MRATARSPDGASARLRDGAIRDPPRIPLTLHAGYAEPGQHQALECIRVIERQADRQYASATCELLQLVVADEPGIVLLGRHQHEPVVIGSSAQRLRLGLRIGMVVGKTALLRDRNAGVGERHEELVRVADSGEGEDGTAAKGGKVAGVRLEPRAKDRNAAGIGGGRDLGWTRAEPDQDHGMRAAELRVERRPQRSGRKHSSVPDAPARIDDNYGEVLMQ